MESTFGDQEREVDEHEELNKRNISINTFAFIRYIHNDNLKSDTYIY